MAWGTIIGAASGSTSALLLSTNDHLTAVRAANPWVIFLLPAGGVLIGFLYRLFSRESAKGNDLVIEHVQGEQGPVPLLMGPVVFVSTFVTHLFGGSTGREGAAIQMGASIAEGVNRAFRVRVPDRRILIIAGVSAGFGSAFGVPIAGTLFGMELIATGKLQFEALVPCLVGSYVGHYTATAWGVDHEKLAVAAMPTMGMALILKVVAAAAIFGLIAVVYSKLKHAIDSGSKRYLGSLPLRAFVGGAAVLVLMLVSGTSAYMGRGLPLLEQAFAGTVSPAAFLRKLVFTAVTMGSGFRGGEIIPLFVTGAALGNSMSGTFGLPASFMAAIGMIAVFCGAANTPVAVFVMGAEIFGGEMMPFLFLACVVSYLVTGRNGIYGAQQVYMPKSRLFGLADGLRITPSGADDA